MQDNEIQHISNQLANIQQNNESVEKETLPQLSDKTIVNICSKFFQSSSMVDPEREINKLNISKETLHAVLQSRSEEISKEIKNYDKPTSVFKKLINFLFKKDEQDKIKSIKTELNDLKKLIENTLKSDKFIKLSNPPNPPKNLVKPSIKSLDSSSDSSLLISASAFNQAIAPDSKLPVPEKKEVKELSPSLSQKASDLKEPSPPAAPPALPIAGEGPPPPPPPLMFKKAEILPMTEFFANEPKELILEKKDFEILTTEEKQDYLEKINGYLDGSKAALKTIEGKLEAKKSIEGEIKEYLASLNSYNKLRQDKARLQEILSKDDDDIDLTYVRIENKMEVIQSVRFYSEASFNKLTSQQQKERVGLKKANALQAINQIINEINGDITKAGSALKSKEDELDKLLQEKSNGIEFKDFQKHLDDKKTRLREWTKKRNELSLMLKSPKSEVVSAPKPVDILPSGDPNDHFDQNFAVTARREGAINQLNIKLD